MEGNTCPATSSTVTIRVVLAEDDVSASAADAATRDDAWKKARRVAVPRPGVAPC